MKITVEQAMGKPELGRFDGRLVSLLELFRKRLLRVIQKCLEYYCCFFGNAGMFSQQC